MLSTLSLSIRSLEHFSCCVVSFLSRMSCLVFLSCHCTHAILLLDDISSWRWCSSTSWANKSARRLASVTDTRSRFLSSSRHPKLFLLFPQKVAKDTGYFRQHVLWSCLQVTSTWQRHTMNKEYKERRQWMKFHFLNDEKLNQSNIVFLEENE